MKLTKPRTSWLIITLFIVFVLVSLSTTSGAVIYMTSDAETQKCMEDFLKDFRLGEITKLPDRPKSFIDSVEFFWDLIKQK